MRDGAAGEFSTEGTNSISYYHYTVNCNHKTEKVPRWLKYLWAFNIGMFTELVIVIVASLS